MHLFSKSLNILPLLQTTSRRILLQEEFWPPIELTPHTFEVGICICLNPRRIIRQAGFKSLSLYALMFLITIDWCKLNFPVFFLNAYITFGVVMLCITQMNLSVYRILCNSGVKKILIQLNISIWIYLILFKMNFSPLTKFHFVKFSVVKWLESFTL